MLARRICLVAFTLMAVAADWPQFRGPNAVGIAEGARLPDKIGKDKNVIWKVEMPPGHSSPIIAADRIYLTAVRDKTKLVTIAVDPTDGKILWEREAPYKKLEKIHTIGSYAQPTPVSDGEVVLSFFGSSGLYCHDKYGKPLWNHPFGPFPNDFGAGSSPLIVGDRVILNQDHDNSSFLIAFDKKSGKQLWKADRSEFPRGYATPVIWEVDGKKQIVVAGTLRVVGYDLDTGAEVWTVRGLSRIANMTPAVGSDNILYLAAWAPGGDETERIEAPPFADMIEKHDKNKNGTLEADELPPGELKNRFTQIDRDKDNKITKDEYENMRRIFTTAQNMVVAIKPGGKGDITATHVLWSQRKQLPYVPSPLYYKNYVYMIKNGGILSCLDARTGKPTKQERVYGKSNYYASPVAGDGKIYLFSERGDFSVVKAGPDWEELSWGKLNEPIFSTPAIADGRIYVRTEKTLYCLGLK
jgi:outer membrane protein assembly factor BamB